MDVECPNCGKIIHCEATREHDGRVLYNGTCECGVSISYGDKFVEDGGTDLFDQLFKPKK